MSVGPLPPAGNIAGAPQAQAASTDSSARKEGADQTRRNAAVQRADDAAGIGKTEEDSQAEDRDADGRLAWERRQSRRTAPDAGEAEDARAEGEVRKSIDPDGVCGNAIDFSA